MNLSLGIVGLPNVGKSTIFNALTANSVPAENYPFCTIEPNVGIIPVNDDRLDKLAEIEKSQRTIPAVIKFVDIAGLVKGASKGEGLGNKFLSHIREVDAIVHVIRRFKDANVTHVDKVIDPSRDIQTIETELMIKDSEFVEKKYKEIERQAKGDESLTEVVKFLKELLGHLNSGKLAYDFKKASNEDIKKYRKELFLLTDKPIIYLVNEAQENINNKLYEKLRKDFKLGKDQKLMILDAKLEVELSQINEEERVEMLKEFDLKERPLDLLVRECYELLGLISFFTACEKESRAWTIYKGDNIVKAAGAIHTDFANKFIAADVISYKDFIKYKGWLKCRETGKVRLEGREYIVNKGDVIIIRHGA